MESKPILVSACIITYNHEKFIRQCLDGALMQDVDYSYEIVIGDDHSTDSTAAICQDYAARYPDIIRFVSRDINLGMNGNWTNTMMSCRGKYIALCEGDDFWTDSNKLQYQVDFLEKNGKYAACYHGAKVIDENNALKRESKWPAYRSHTKLELLQSKGEMITCTVVFRNLVVKNLSSFRGTNLDTYLWHLLGFYGGGKFMGNICYSCYRVHSGGIWSLKNDYFKLISGLKTYDYIVESLSNAGYETQHVHEITSKMLDTFLIRQLKFGSISMYFRGGVLVFKHKSLAISSFLRRHLGTLLKKKWINTCIF